ncbi:Fold protein [Quillaja saponaria]|uniref:Fold protein n=1 Tax=Quillaja saponaria TaxID=32244 RepID=A0AAD7Q1I6_QUISA|nr:Fold protein [Quillaja saponaria]
MGDHMASDETMALHSSMQEEYIDDDFEDGHDHHHNPHPHNLSRLSVCTSSTMCGIDDDDVMRMYMSRLSIQSFDGEGVGDGDGDGDADEEFSDGKEQPEAGLMFSDSENELGSCYSLPATPSRRRNHGGLLNQSLIGVEKYASENEAQKGVIMGKKMSNNDPKRKRRSRRITIGCASHNWENFDMNKKKEEDHVMGLNYSHSFSGESDQSGGTGLRVITRPKGGRRSLCMDLEEVKACRDLGFELEHERMMEMPTRPTVSNSTLDTSSGGNSPIANWRISSPGDDPRDVKARLKVWAQAVALASATKCDS